MQWEHGDAEQTRARELLVPRSHVAALLPGTSAVASSLASPLLTHRNLLPVRARGCAGQGLRAVGPSQDLTAA